MLASARARLSDDQEVEPWAFPPFVQRRRASLLRGDESTRGCHRRACETHHLCCVIAQRLARSSRARRRSTMRSHVGEDARSELPEYAATLHHRARLRGRVQRRPSHACRSGWRARAQTLHAWRFALGRGARALVRLHRLILATREESRDCQQGLARLRRQLCRSCRSRTLRSTHRANAAAVQTACRVVRRGVALPSNQCALREVHAVDALDRPPPRRFQEPRQDSPLGSSTTGSRL